MDGGVAAALIAAISGAILGGAGFWRSRKADAAQVQLSERTVDREDFDSVTEGQRGLIAQLRIDVEELRRRLGEKDAAIDALHVEVRHCEADKVELNASVSRLTSRVRELERSR